MLLPPVSMRYSYISPSNGAYRFVKSWPDDIYWIHNSNLIYAGVVTVDELHQPAWVSMFRHLRALTMRMKGWLKPEYPL